MVGVGGESRVRLWFFGNILVKEVLETSSSLDVASQFRSLGLSSLFFFDSLVKCFEVISYFKVGAKAWVPEKHIESQHDVPFSKVSVLIKVVGKRQDQPEEPAFLAHVLLVVHNLEAEVGELVLVGCHSLDRCLDDFDQLRRQSFWLEILIVVSFVSWCR